MKPPAAQTRDCRLDIQQCYMTLHGVEGSRFDIQQCCMTLHGVTKGVRMTYWLCDILS